MTDEERSQIESLLGYRFRHPELLERSLTHRSLHQGVAGADYERLEFLGDRVLGLIASEWLFSRYPGWEAGELSKGLARLVSAASVQQAAQRLQLGAHLRLGPGEEKTGGREKRRLLSDAYEAVLAAIYLDGDLAAAAEFAGRTLLEPALSSESEALDRSDYKSALQEWLQERGRSVVEYRLIDATGPDHLKTFLVEAWHEGRPLSSASGRSKKEAEQAAAKLALEIVTSV